MIIYHYFTIYYHDNLSRANSSQYSAALGMRSSLKSKLGEWFIGELGYFAEVRKKNAPGLFSRK